MVLAIGIGYWIGATVLWLPLALMLRGRDSEQQGIALVIAGVVLAMVWPASLPIAILVYAARHVRRHPADVPETALLGI